MTPTDGPVPLALDEFHVAMHQFIRLFGRRPTAEELTRYQQAQVRVHTRTPSRFRRDAARLISRL